MEEKKFQKGDKVIYYRTPSDSEWIGVGKITHHLALGNECTVYNIESRGSTFPIQVMYNGHITAWIPKEAFQFVTGKFLKDDYIVTLKGDFSDTSCAKENFCFKQREDAVYLRPAPDLKGSYINGNDTVRFDKTKSGCTSWRYATDKEVLEYEKLKIPYDVSTLEIYELVPESKEALLKKAKEMYPINTWYEAISDGDIEVCKVTLEPRFHSCNRGKNCIIGHYGGGLLYAADTNTWAKIVLPKPPIFKIGDWVVVLNTENVRFFNSDGVGHHFQISEMADLNRLLCGEKTALDIQNKYSTNYGIHDLRLATSEEVVLFTLNHKFKIGDRVKVVVTGSGIGFDDAGRHCTITELGEYSGSAGYKMDPPMGNTLSGSYRGMVAEISFELLSKDAQYCVKKEIMTPEVEIISRSESLKIGDYVEIVNLKNKSGSVNLNGIIGHKGKITSQDMDGMFRLSPSCTGNCWYSHNLRKVDPLMERVHESRPDFTIKDMTEALSTIYSSSKKDIPEYKSSLTREMFEWEIIVDSKVISNTVKPIIIPVKKL